MTFAYYALFCVWNCANWKTNSKTMGILSVRDDFKVYSKLHCISLSSCQETVSKLKWYGHCVYMYAGRHMQTSTHLLVQKRANWDVAKQIRTLLDCL